MSVWIFVLVGTGGAAGAVLRYAVGKWFTRRRARAIFGTLLVNTSGSLAIGLLIGLRLQEGNAALFALLGTGLLGGLTTYSTLNVQKAHLAAGKAGRTLAKYIGATYMGGWILTGLGIWLGHALSLST